MVGINMKRVTSTAAGAIQKKIKRPWARFDSYYVSFLFKNGEL